MTFALPGALDVLVNEMEFTREDAKTILNHLQMKLDEMFTGQPWLPDVVSNILAFLEQSFPAPPTHRWELSQVGTGTVYVNLVPRNGVPAGYSFAARVTIGMDGGNHPLKGDLWKHDECGCLIFPGDKDAHDRFHAALRG